RRDREVWRGLHRKREAQTRTLAIVHVFSDAAAFAQRIDEAAILGVIADSAHREHARHQRHVDHTSEMAAFATAIDHVHLRFDGAFEHVEVRLIGDVANRAADIARTEQRALRPAQWFDAVEIVEIEVWREQRQRDDRVIEIDADLLFHTRLVAHDLTGGNAAQRNLALTWAKVLHGHAGDVAAQIFE